MATVLPLMEGERELDEKKDSMEKGELVPVSKTEEKA